jgi:hypothetical protein
VLGVAPVSLETWGSLLAPALAALAAIELHKRWAARRGALR